jgi:hypothetical protein
VSKDASETVATVAEWCKVVLGFLLEKRLLDVHLHRQLLSVASQTEAEGDLRGLRQIKRDLKDMARHIPKKDATELSRLLELTTGDNKDDSELATILNRGTVETEEEARFLMTRVDEIFQDPSKRDELKFINQMLAKSKLY